MDHHSVRPDHSAPQSKAASDPDSESTERQSSVPLLNLPHIFAGDGKPNRDQVLALQRLIGNRETGRLLSRVTLQRSAAIPSIQRAPDSSAPAFKKQSDVRKQQFIQSATSGDQPLGEHEAEQLYGLTDSGQLDPVTGAEDITDYDPTLARAIEAVKGKEGVAFNVRVAVRNLGGLNAQGGHQQTDAILKTFADTISGALEQVGGSVSKFRHGAELQFIVVGENIRQSHIEAQLMVAQATVEHQAINSGLTGVQHPKHGDHVAERGTGIRYDIQPIKASHQANESGPAAQNAEHGRGVDFRNAAQGRRDQFMAAAIEQYGLPQSKAESLYTLAGGDTVDVLTGFDKAGDRITTLQSALAFCRQQRATGVYVEVDVHNLGGLTQAKGREKADAVFRELTRRTEGAIMQVSGDVSRFRHGGDEFSFIIVGKQVNAGAVESALQSAQAEIAVYSQQEGLAAIPHPKHPNNRSKDGTGIVFGLSSFTGLESETVEKILSTADQQVEARKQA